MRDESFIAIKGNHVDQAAEIFAAFNYIDNKNDHRFDAWKKAQEYINDRWAEAAKKIEQDRCIWFYNGWTIISDPDGGDFLDREAKAAIAKKFDADVFSIIMQGGAYSYGFEKYSPARIRFFWSTEGVISNNEGAPLPEESGLNINENIDENDIVQLAAKLGIELDAGKVKSTFIVKELSYTEEIKEGVRKAAERGKEMEAAKDREAAKKPWWKMW